MLGALKNMLGLVKRRARRSLVELVTADDNKGGQIAAQQRRSKAARGLIKIIENERGGEKIVARRFVKTASRRDTGIRALLKLSDDELDQFGYSAASPPSDSITSVPLLRAVLKYSEKPSFFQRTISTALRERAEGVAAILDLATLETDSFFWNISHQIIVTFCKKLITKEGSGSPKWYCAVKLLCLLFITKPSPERGDALPLIRRILPSILRGLIQKIQATLTPDATERSETDLVTACPSLLPLLAVCCEEIQSQGYWSAFPPSDTLNPFITMLVDFIRPVDAGLRRLSTERGFALWTLMSLLKRRSIVSFMPEIELGKIGTTFMDMTLHTWVVDTQGDVFEKAILRPLNSKLDLWCIESLCNLPRPICINALALALNQGVLQLNSPQTYPYQPLGLVERLLWLSNLKSPVESSEHVHRALVKGGACEFLTRVLSHTGDLAPRDRGLWRAKGLAMTCFGNIVERMDMRKLRTHVSKEMIDAVVAVKEHGDVPLVQKGQAIFMLQRYTLTANRWSVEPYYREDTSNLAEESSNSDSDDG